MVYTTLNRIRAQSPCQEGWAKLLKSLDKTAADDEPLSFVTILDSNGLDDALWCCRAEPQHASLWRHFAVDCAESVRHLMTDARSTAALDVARRHANGEATDQELAAARAAAWGASWDAAMGAAWAAARGAARAAARDAAWGASWGASWGAARGAARGAAWDALEQRFRHLVTVGVWSPIEVQQ